MIKHTQALSGQRVIHQFRGRASNIYVLEDRRTGSAYLIDCGLPSDSAALAEVLRPLPPLKQVVCTHFHVDHASGWLKLKNYFADSSILFYEKARPWVQGHKRLDFPSWRDYRSSLLPVMRDYGYTPRLYDMAQSRLYATPLRKGFPLQQICFFNAAETPVPGFRTIPTPGHRPDAVSFLDLDSGILLAGDFLLVINGRLVSNPFLSSAQDQKQSLANILSLDAVRWIFPGHGPCVPLGPNSTLSLHLGACHAGLI